MVLWTMFICLWFHSYKGCQYFTVFLFLQYQVVTIATYSYFLACTIGRQYLDPKAGYAGHTFDLYFPGFTVLEFVFYVGWLKVSAKTVPDETFYQAMLTLNTDWNVLFKTRYI